MIYTHAHTHTHTHTRTCIKNPSSEAFLSGADTQYTHVSSSSDFPSSEAFLSGADTPQYSMSHAEEDTCVLSGSDVGSIGGSFRWVRLSSCLV